MATDKEEDVLHLLFDNISKMYTLQHSTEGPEFLGPFDIANLTLQSKYGLTEAQARAAMTKATMTDGFPISIDDIIRITGPTYVTAA